MLPLPRAMPPYGAARRFAHGASGPIQGSAAQDDP